MDEPTEQIVVENIAAIGDPVGSVISGDIAPPLRVLFAAPQSSTPIHALRSGTFTDSMGRETTFAPADLAQMAARLNEGTARRRPPINEQHDMGRAVGRMLSAYTRHGDNHLYIEPKWNSAGAGLLMEEVYDAFSIELSPHPKGGWSIIGGALTNYPAVDGLKPVSMSSAARGGTATIYMPTGESPVVNEETPTMPDEQTAQPVNPPAAPPPPAMPTLDLSDPLVRQQVESYQAEMRTAYVRQHELAMQAARDQARVEFERWKADETRRARLLTFAQQITTQTMSRPTAIAWTVEQVMDALLTPTAETVQRIFEDALAGALLVSGQIVGSTRGDGDAPSDSAQWDALVFSIRQANAGMSATDAMKAAARKRPDLYAAQSQPKGGR